MFAAVVLAALFAWLSTSPPLLWIYVTITIYVGAFAVLFFRLRTSEPYGGYHVALNAGAGKSHRPETEWLNMGLWEQTQDFPQACEALALRLLKAARCMPNGHVLDVGHACGDSLLLHLRHPDVPRPGSLTGITSLPSQHSRSLERIVQHQSTTQAELPTMKLFCGDAVFRFGHPDHPLDPSTSFSQYTTVLALDCAYHFNSRQDFLRQSFQALRPGGSIALADLIISKPIHPAFRAVLSSLLSVRSKNMISLNTYEEQLRTIGYANIHIEDISENVFPGFRSFLISRGGVWRIFEFVIGWWVNAGGRFVIVNASKPEMLAASGPYLDHVFVS